MCMHCSHVQVHALAKGRAPPPGLYGPFVTGDFAFWNGEGEGEGEGGGF